MSVSPLAKPFSRSIAPRSHTRWLQREDEGEALQSLVADWLKDVATNEQLFKENVYENQNANEGDFRQHRAHLCALLADGNCIALGLLEWAQQEQKGEQISAYIILLDQKLKELLETLFAWHGNLKSQTDVPDSFKQAADQIEHGNIVDFKEP